MNILLVTEHRELGKKTLKNILNERPYWNVSLARMGPEAHKALQDSNYDAIVIEVFHSNGAAFDMISSLSVDHPSLPVITASTYFSNGLVEKIELSCDSSCVCDIKDTEECVNTIERVCC